MLDGKGLMLVVDSNRNKRWVLRYTRPDGRRNMIGLGSYPTVIRQRLGTASGVTFLTLEDETGSINVVVWRDLADKQRLELLDSKLLGLHMGCCRGTAKWLILLRGI